MQMPERQRTPRTRIAVGLVAVLALLALLAHEVILNRRVVALEAAVAERAAADPLLAVECRISDPNRREIWGQVREKPCQVSFQRLLDAPQQFEGRWVEVQGRYSSGMESSALFALNSNPPAEGWESYEHALWVDVEPFAKADAQKRGVVVGRFRRGPAGHLAQYFAALGDR